MFASVFHCMCGLLRLCFDAVTDFLASFGQDWPSDLPCQRAFIDQHGMFYVPAASYILMQGMAKTKEEKRVFGMRLQNIPSKSSQTAAEDLFISKRLLLAQREVLMGMLARPPSIEKEAKNLAEEANIIHEYLKGMGK